MDSERFDALARALTVTSRRTLVTIICATGLSALGAQLDLVDAQAGNKKKKKKKKKRGGSCPRGCSACEKCVKGVCQAVTNGTVCGLSGCTVCVSGTCQAVANGSLCDQGGCKACTNGACQNVTNGTGCSRGACRSGECRCTSSDHCPGGGTACFCRAEFETGENRCWVNEGDDCNFITGNCDENSDCDPGEGCMQQSCWGPTIGICWPLCAG